MKKGFFLSTGNGHARRNYTQLWVHSLREEEGKNGNASINGMNHHFNAQIEACTNEDPIYGIRVSSLGFSKFWIDSNGQKTLFGRTRNGHVQMYSTGSHISINVPIRHVRYRKSDSNPGVSVKWETKHSVTKRNETKSVNWETKRNRICKLRNETKRNETIQWILKIL